MPYIITTKAPPTLPSTLPSHTLTGKPIYAVSRRAVGTLDEARHEASNKISRPEDGDPVEWDGFVFQAWRLPEAGGTVGPLPDGTVIEVQPIEWVALAQANSLEPFDTDRGRWRVQEELVDAYNAAQED